MSRFLGCWYDVSMSYQDLEVWKLSIDLAEEVYRVADRLPTRERTVLTDQLRRAVISIALNIAEGTARTTNKEFRRFVDIARGSLRETETCLVLTVRFKFIEHGDLNRCRELCGSVGRMLTALRKSLT